MKHGRTWTEAGSLLGSRLESEMLLFSSFFFFYKVSSVSPEPMHDNGTQTIKAEVVEPIVEAPETCREEANTSSSYSPSPRTVYTCNDGKVGLRRLMLIKTLIYSQPTLVKCRLICHIQSKTALDLSRILGDLCSVLWLFFNHYIFSFFCLFVELQSLLQMLSKQCSRVVTCRQICT